MFSKKGEKSLQMIFGLFILLIISLVVLSLFFKFIGKSSSQTEAITTKYFSESQKGNVIQECENLCGNIKGIDGAIEFCRKTYQVDWNGNNIQGNLISEGRWEFCEDKIPCFILVECRGYTGLDCKSILSTQRQDFLTELTKDNVSGTCGMSNTDSNWMKKFEFSGGSPGGCLAGEVFNMLTNSCGPDPSRFI